MPEILREVVCPHCGAPLKFDKGDIIFTCHYCGYTGLLNVSKPFTFEHSMFVNQISADLVENIVRDWFSEGFLKPPDLRKRGRVVEKNLFYVPLWIISLNAVTSFEGYFERLGPSIVRKDVIRGSYDWIVIARKNTPFPEREYRLGLASKVPFEVGRVEKYSIVLNSEIDSDEAEGRAVEGVRSLHKYLVQREVDKILSFSCEVKVLEKNYLHAPIWFIVYEYKGGLYKLYIDGARKDVIFGEVPEI
ncbi:MAG: hypothetical protein QW134_07865 [Nitrososphaeria archaeon]